MNDAFAGIRPPASEKQTAPDLFPREIRNAVRRQETRTESESATTCFVDAVKHPLLFVWHIVLINVAVRPTSEASSFTWRAIVVLLNIYYLMNVRDITGPLSGGSDGST